MTFPVVETSAFSTEDGGNVTSHTVDYPTGIANGDLLLAFFGVDGNPTITWPSEGSSWIELVDQSNGTAATLGVAWRAANGTETGSFEVATSNAQRSSHCVFRISGAESPAISPPVYGGNATGSDTAPNPLSLDPSAGTQDFLWFAGYARDRDDSNTGWPTNYSEGNGESQDGGGANSAGVTAAWRQNNAATENADAFTMDGGGDEWVAGAVAVFPIAPRSGTGAQLLGGLSQAGAGTMQPSGAGAQTLKALTQAGAGVTYQSLAALSDGIMAVQNGFCGPWEFTDPTPIVVNAETQSFTGFGEATDDEKVGQSFTAIDGTITAVKFTVNQAGSPTDGVQVSLQVDDGGGDPDGVIIDSIIVDQSDIASGAGTDITFSFKVPLTVVSADIYWIVLERTGALNDSDKYNIDTDTGNNYANGRHSYLVQSTQNWTSGTSRDWNFSIFALAKYTVLTSADQGQLHVAKTSIDPPADGDWASQDDTNAPQPGTIESYWAVLARADTADVDENNTGTNKTFGDDAARTKIAQSFSVLTGALAAFRMRFKESGTVTDEMVWSLQRDNAGAPDGIIIESRSLGPADLTGSYQDFFFALKQPVSVSPGDVYWLVLGRTGSLDISNFYNVEFANSDTYSDGGKAEFDGSDWTNSNLDFGFSVYLADIHIFAQQDNGRVSYSTFDPGTDAYLVIDEEVSTAGASQPADYETAPDTPTLVGAIRADGDSVVFYAGIRDSDATDNIYWARRESGSWTRANDVLSTGKLILQTIAGPDQDDLITRIDRLDLFDRLEARTVDKDNALGTSTTIDTTADTAFFFAGPGVIDKNNRIFFSYIDVDNKPALCEWPSANPPVPVLTATIGDNTAYGHGRTTAPGAAICLALNDGTEVHLVYANGADQDLYHDDYVDQGGTTDVEILDAVTVNRVSCYMGVTDLLVIYDDAGTTKFLSVATVKASENMTNLDDGLMGIQNSFSGPWETQ